MTKLTNKIAKSFATLALILSMGSTALAENKVVGGAEMFPDKNIIENAVNSGDHKTL